MKEMNAQHFVFTFTYKKSYRRLKIEEDSEK